MSVGVHSHKLSHTHRLLESARFVCLRVRFAAGPLENRQLSTTSVSRAPVLSALSFRRISLVRVQNTDIVRGVWFMTGRRTPDPSSVSHRLLETRLGLSLLGLMERRDVRRGIRFGLPAICAAPRKPRRDRFRTPSSPSFVLTLRGSPNKDDPPSSGQDGTRERSIS